MNQTKTQLILYLCPAGPLAEQIETYFAQTKADIGENTAHTYMPHCTLTGFFWDLPESVPIYQAALDQHLAQNPVNGSDIHVKKLTHSEKWIGLEMAAPDVQRWTADWSAVVRSPTLEENIRLKDWYHLSLAYGFDPAVYQPLRQRTDLIDPAADVRWSLRFYERAAGNRWQLHWKSDLL